MVHDEHKAIVIFEGDVYDTTDFKITHPGGPKYIDDNIGKDISQIFYDNDHSKIALRLLNETKIGTFQEQTNGNSTKNHLNGKERMKEIENEAWREIIDPAQGTIYQVMTKLNYDEYLNFVNDPKHLTRPGDIHRMFKTPFLDFFSRTPWYHIVWFWSPVVLYKIWQGFDHLSLIELVLYFLFGMFTWTFIEYSLHRFVFHMEIYIPDNRILRGIHFMFHGVHHAFPMDKDRLVFPIAMAIPLYFLIYYLLSLIYPKTGMDVIMGGVVWMYIFYDAGHYYFHHAQPIKAAEYRKKYHMYHHYKDPYKGFGISTSFWDIIFKTEIILPKKSVE